MSPLHHLGEFLRTQLAGIPLSAARGLFVLLLAGLLIWVLALPKNQVQSAQRTPRLSENLKLWASLALLVQIVIYLVF